jgi:phosphohistidine swiveling domain-containing protein
MRPSNVSEEGALVPGAIGVLALDDPASSDPAIAGAKATALSVARSAGLPVLDGFVISTAATAAWRDADGPPDWVVPSLRSAWLRLSAGDQPVVVRSSSPNEDTRTSSMAGQFRSILDVSSWDGVLDAVREVIDSGDGEPMAVVVQPFVRPVWGGVLFGADPVTGRRDRLVVAAVPGGPDKLVSGAVTGGQFSLSARGRLLDATGEVPERLLGRSVRRMLVRLATATAHLFGEPQDVEWAVERDGGLLLLQSRPITTVGHEVEATGPVLGPGPLAETFPVALAPLEEDLWIPPLRDGLRRALEIVGSTSSRRLRRSPVVVAIDGRPAVDLDLLGLSPVRRRWWARLDPRPPGRRLLAAWRVGRLRAALPALATDVLAEVDGEMRALPRLDRLAPSQLVTLLERSGDVLRTLHGYEVLAGQLLASDTNAPTAASRALEVLAEAHTDASQAQPPTSGRNGHSAAVARRDEELVAQHPVLLSLLPPAIGRELVLPPPPASSLARRPRSEAATLDLAVTRREALRLRIRWVHELTARAAQALGQHLVRRGVIDQWTDVRYLWLDELRDLVVGGAASPEGEHPVPGRKGHPANGVDAPLPRAFRQAGDVIVPVALESGRRGGRGAGGGRGMGRAHHHDAGPPPEGAVLIVTNLDPSLASLLPGLSGLVAETGSVLSHLAILAREHGVPTVVDLPDARERYPDGTWVVVDGASGDVTTVESEEWRAA